MSEDRKNKYDEIIKDPKTKMLQSLYTLLAQVSSHILPTVLVCGANFFEVHGTLHKEIVKSAKLLELTYDCFAGIKKRVETLFDTEDFINKPLHELRESGLKSQNMIKKSALGFSYIPNVPIRNFQSFSNTQRQTDLGPEHAKSNGDPKYLLGKTTDKEYQFRKKHG